MRHVRDLVLSGVLCAGLLGCGVKKASDEEYRAVGAALNESGTFRTFAIRQCEEGNKGMTATQRWSLSRLMRVPEDRVVSEACRRIVREMANGKIPQEDLLALRVGVMPVFVREALKTP